VCCISFDDGLASVYDIAFPVLKAYNLPFCIFVNTISVDNKKLLWLHALSFLIAKYGFESVKLALHRCAGESATPSVASARTPRELLLWCRKNFDLLYTLEWIDRLMSSFEIDSVDVAEQQKLYLTWDSLNEMHAGGVEIFSHTHSHCPLDKLSSF